MKKVSVGGVVGEFFLFGVLLSVRSTGVWYWPALACTCLHLPLPAPRLDRERVRAGFLIHSRLWEK